MTKVLNILILREMQVKTTMKYQLTPVIMAVTNNSTKNSNAREGVERREPSLTVGGIVNWFNHDGRAYGRSSEK